MTIVGAIKKVLYQMPDELTSKEIYDEIVKQNLYSLAYPVKVFRIVGHRGDKNKFALYDESIPQDKDQSSKTTKNVAEELPEERIGAALKEHIASIKQQVLDSILNNSPELFEHLVLDLLLKMGYGYGKQAGVVTGQPHDGGIDGIISEDKLGLDLIYIQAKRYAPKNKIGRSELQAFIGAMEHI